MAAVFPVKTLLPCFHNIYHPAGRLLIKGLQGIEPVAVLRESHGDHGKAFHIRKISREILNGPLQLPSVVDSWTADDLAVHRNLRVIKNLDLFQGLSRKPVMKHHAPQLRVCGMHRNIDGRQMKLYDSLQIMVAQIRQCHIISLQKRKPGIIVLKIQGFPHSRRHLIDKAENAPVAAGTVIAHQAVFKIQPQVLVIILDVQFPLFPVLLQYNGRHTVIVQFILIIKNILDWLIIKSEQYVARFELHLLGNRAGIDGFNEMSFILHNKIIVPIR